MDTIIHTQPYEQGKKKKWALNCEEHQKEHPEW